MKTRIKTHIFPGDVSKVTKQAMLERRHEDPKRSRAFKKVLLARERAVIKERVQKDVTAELARHAEDVEEKRNTYEDYQSEFDPVRPLPVEFYAWAQQVGALLDSLPPLMVPLNCCFRSDAPCKHRR